MTTPTSYVGGPCAVVKDWYVLTRIYTAQFQQGKRLLCMTAPHTIIMSLLSILCANKGNKFASMCIPLKLFSREVLMHSNPNQHKQLEQDWPWTLGVHDYQFCHTKVILQTPVTIHRITIVNSSITKKRMTTTIACFQKQ